VLGTGNRLAAIALIAVSLACATAIAAFGHARPLTKEQLRSCLGEGKPHSAPVTGARANPSVLSAFHAFSETSTKHLRIQGIAGLGYEDVATYDPTEIVHFASPAAQWRLALMPVTMAPPSLPKYCTRIRGWRAAQTPASLDSGPGVCLLAAVTDGDGLDLQGASCEPLTGLNSYFGPLDLAEWGFDPRAVTLLPDGVSAVRYTFSSGKKITVSVRGNLLATPLFALPGYNAGIPEAYKPKVFRKWFPRQFPVEITLLGPAGSLFAQYRRPAGLFDQLEAANRLALMAWNLIPPSQRPN
jgi:hypothetical protein